MGTKRLDKQLEEYNYIQFHQCEREGINNYKLDKVDITSKIELLKFLNILEEDVIDTFIIHTNVSTKIITIVKHQDGRFSYVTRDTRRWDDIVRATHTKVIAVDFDDEP